ncbi:glycosyltransferase [Nakamurella antarctica]|uniref:4,4'-diaponeurosporenoate glycosyltransferase n=2 Tax=Nakamurella antarctica TaxID=1902245 RepID=A0A3G8ZR01_9ACTN|nr:glycosyltransferase [Nakamurella antarctica]
MFDRVVVVVPAKNEAASLPSCLRALSAAAAEVVIPVSVIVVLDDCTDSSETVVREAAALPTIGVEMLTVQVSNVGAARKAGFDSALAKKNADGLWLATTDADSQVPSHWFAAQLRHAHLGAAIVMGTVTVADWSGRSPEVQNLAEKLYDRGPHRHIHGTNLSFTAVAYQQVGGFATLASSEDVALVTAFAAAGLPAAWATDMPVTTSARRISRAPRGFAAYLNNLQQQIPISAAPQRLPAHL